MERNMQSDVSGFKRVPSGKRAVTLGLVIILLLSLFLTAAIPTPPTSLPWFEVEDVYPGNWVRIKCFNFYMTESFDFWMGAAGTNGEGGIYVGNANSRTDQNFEITLEIPFALRNKATIDLRADSIDGYLYYDSFTNVVGGASAGSTTGSTSGTGYTGYIPTFDITAVVPDTSVTIMTHNFPAGENFTVRMGPYGSYGIGGTIVATTDSGVGGSFAATYSIPAGLKGSNMVAIRMDSPDGYYSFNYFTNVASSSSSGSVTPTTVPLVPPSYNGFPYFYITKVVKDASVTVDGHNFPPNQQFTVTMGAYGTYGIGGVVVAITNSDAGGTLTATYTIPTSLVGSDLIAVRLESTQGLFAYNWFFNNSTP